MKSIIKRLMKRVLSEKMIVCLRTVYLIFKELKFSITGIKGIIEVNESVVDEYTEFEHRGSHLFFGYYDLMQIRNSRILFHKVTKEADTKKDLCLIGWIDANTHEMHEIATTQTWCWQQGARLRWNPQKENEILFNSLHDGQYCTEVWNASSGEFIRRYNLPLYDINSNMTYGASLNFSRLQRLRPGYGYNVLPDKTEDEDAPKDDGIFLYDIQKERYELVVSLKQLSESVNSGNSQHYVNHISFSPSGDRFMFFHLWTGQDPNIWSNRLCVYDLKGELKSFDYDDWVVSHYDWKDDEHILVTEGKLASGDARYMIYNIQDLSKSIINLPTLNRDGHPTWISDTRFLTDTYPDLNRLQKIFISGDSENDLQIAKVYASPYWNGEKRCDLHPRITEDRSLICFDCAKNGERSMILLKMKDDLREKRIS